MDECWICTNFASVKGRILLHRRTQHYRNTRRSYALLAVMTGKMAPLAGFEPTTPEVEARHSVQLSYRGIDL